MGGKGWSGGSCMDHTLIPRPPSDGRLRPRPLSPGRRAASVHEDQLRAPGGEGRHQSSGLECGGEWGCGCSRSPFTTLDLGGATGSAKGETLGNQEQGSNSPSNQPGSTSKRVTSAGVGGPRGRGGSEGNSVCMCACVCAPAHTGDRGLGTGGKPLVTHPMPFCVLQNGPCGCSAPLSSSGGQSLRHPHHQA